MTGDLVALIQCHVGCARAALAEEDAVAGAHFLGEAEMAAGEVEDAALAGATFQAVLDLRNELECYLLAAEQLRDAGVESGVVIAVLRRGAATAEAILGRLAVAVAS